MSVATDLASAYQERELTVPVQAGALSTRGFLDRSAALEAGDGTRYQRAVDVLHVQHGALAGLAVDATLVVGQVGAATTVADDPTFVVQAIEPTGDGLEDLVVLAELGLAP